MKNHYKIHKPEAIDLIDRYDLNFIEGNIVKYILRSPFKGDRIGDLKKALYYAKKLPNKLVYEGKREEFDIDELDQYLDSHALYAIEVSAVASVIQRNFFHTEKLIEMAIEDRENKMKTPENKSMEQIEMEADNLAVQILMPKKLLERNFPFQMKQDRTISLMEVQQIANYFKVSLPVAYGRLVQLGKKLEYLSEVFYT